MSDVLQTAHQVSNNSVTRNCRLQAIGDASCSMVNKPNALATESGDQRASSQSAHTRQQLDISENNDLNTPAAAPAAAAQAAAVAAGSKQPASPDSVNAGQPAGKAPAQQHAASSPASTDPEATAAGTTSADRHTASHPHSSPAPTTSADLTTEHQQQQGQLLQQQVPVVVQQPKQQQQQQGQEHQQELQQQQQAGPELEALEPLSPPDASEGPEALAEYDVYLQRWRAGDTLAQRWQR